MFSLEYVQITLKWIDSLSNIVQAITLTRHKGLHVPAPAHFPSAHERASYH